VSVAVRAEDGAVVLEVADRGPGIPAAEVERLKQPFTRLEVARSDKGGAGLGSPSSSAWCARTAALSSCSRAKRRPSRAHPASELEGDAGSGRERFFRVHFARQIKRTAMKETARRPRPGRRSRAFAQTCPEKKPALLAGFPGRGRITTYRRGISSSVLKKKCPSIETIIQYKPGVGGAVMWNQMNSLPADGLNIVASTCRTSCLRVRRPGAVQDRGHHADVLVSLHPGRARGARIQSLQDLPGLRQGGEG